MRSFFLLLFSFFTLGLWAIGLEDLKNRNIIESLSVERIEIVDNFGEYFHGKTLYKYSYTFNSNGKITEYIGEFHRKERELFIYDKNGNILEISRYGDNESILSKKKYLYNDKGYILEEVEYNSSGSASKKRKYSYNDNDKLIADVSYSIDGTIETSRTFSYNEDNKLISKVEKSGLWSSITSITFDDNGNINEYVDHYWDNSISSTYSTLYNSEFAKIKVDKINGDGSIQHLVSSPAKFVRFYPARVVRFSAKKLFDANGSDFQASLHTVGISL